MILFTEQAYSGFFAHVIVRTSRLRISLGRWRPSNQLGYIHRAFLTNEIEVAFRNGQRSIENCKQMHTPDSMKRGQSFDVRTAGVLVFVCVN